MVVPGVIPQADGSDDESSVGSFSHRADVGKERGRSSLTTAGAEPPRKQLGDARAVKVISTAGAAGGPGHTRDHNSARTKTSAVIRSKSSVIIGSTVSPLEVQRVRERRQRRRKNGACLSTRDMPGGGGHWREELLCDGAPLVQGRTATVRGRVSSVR